MMMSHDWSITSTGTTKRANAGTARYCPRKSATTHCRGVWGTTPDNVFVTTGHKFILHWDGVSWTAMTTPTLHWLNGIWGSGPDDIFASGNEGTIVHYDGMSWQPDPVGGSMAPDGSEPYSHDINGAWGGGADKTFAVGRTEPDRDHIGPGSLLRYNDADRSWEVMDLPSMPDGDAIPDLLSVWVSEQDNTAIATGKFGTVLRFDTTGSLESTHVVQPLWADSCRTSACPMLFNGVWASETMSSSPWPATPMM